MEGQIGANVVLTNEMIEKFVDIYSERGKSPEGSSAGMIELGWTVRLTIHAKEYEAWVALAEMPVAEVAKDFPFIKWLLPLFSTPFILGHNLFLAYRSLVGPKFFAKLKKKGKISRKNLYVAELMPNDETEPDKRKEIEDEIIYGVFNGKILPIEQDQEDLAQDALALLCEALSEKVDKLPEKKQQAKEVGLKLVRKMFEFMPQENIEALMEELEID